MRGSGGNYSPQAGYGAAAPKIPNCIPQPGGYGARMREILLPFPPGCIEGRLIRRVKRFIVYFEADGRELTAHSNNSGSMLGLTRPG